jgi:hypothetical protein
MFVDLFKLSDLSRAQNLINCIRLRLTRTEKLAIEALFKSAVNSALAFPARCLDG